MAFVVEDGTGLSTATSLASVAEADAYHVGHPDEATWNALTTAQKEYLLNEASRLARQRITWLGYRVLTTQALPFPRAGIYVDGSLVASTSVPADIRDGVAELARRISALTTIVSSTTTPEIRRESVGPLAYTYGPGGKSGGSQMAGIPAAVLDHWGPYIERQKFVVRA